MLDGLTALSLLVKITFWTLLSNADCIKLLTPVKFVLIASNGLYSDILTCFRAAQ